MATFPVKDVTFLVVGADATKTTGNIDSLNSGEIGLFTPSGVRLTEANAATNDQFIIVRDNGSTDVNWHSGILDKRNIKRIKAKAYVADQEQIDYLGYNGTSGSITVINDNLYFLRLSFHETIVGTHGGIYIKHGTYKSDLTATQQEIAQGLCSSLVADLSRDPDRVINVFRKSSITTVNLAETYTANYGSRWLAASGAVTCAVGDVVRFGGTTTSLPCYIVTAVGPGNAIQIDVPYQGTSAAGITVSNGTPVGTENWGLLFTGLAQLFRTGKIHNKKISWNTTLEGFGATPFGTTQFYSMGNGTERQIKELEFFAQGFQGEIYRSPEPMVFPRREQASGTYDMITIEFEELFKDSIVTGPIKQTYILAIPSTTPNYAVTGTANDITDVLEVLAFGAVDGSLNL